MDPSANQANPNAPGPPVSSSQSGFQFTPSPFSAPSRGPNPTGSLFGQTVQFGSNNAAPPDRKPFSEPVLNNLFASSKSATSIFGGKAGEQTSDATDVTKPPTLSVKFEAVEEKDQPAGSSSAIMAKSRFAPAFGSLFGGHQSRESGGNTQKGVDNKVTSVTQMTTVTSFTDTSEGIAGNVPAEYTEARVERKKEGGKHAHRNISAKDRIRNIISGNRVEGTAEELTKLQALRESILWKLEERKVEKKRKSTDSSDGSPG